MSYITDALKRSQKANDDRYFPYRGLILSRRRRGVRGRKRLIFGVSLVSLAFLASTAFSLIVFFGQDPAGKENDVTAIPPPAVYRAKINAAARQPAPLAPEHPARDADILFQAALRRQQAGDLGDAEALYRKALGIDPKNLNALNNLGVLYTSQKRDREAIDIFNTLIDARGNWADPYYNLACLYSRQGNAPKSLWYLRVALWMDRELKEWARNDSDLEPLHTRPEYNKIVN